MRLPVAVEILLGAGRKGEPPQRDLVTVAVSLFNYDAHIVECLDSVAAQDHGAIELIVVDDASSDESAVTAARWLEDHSARFTRTALLRHAVNEGLAETRNTAFARASADYVMVLDADNGLFPRAIGRLLESAVDADAALAYSQAALFGDVQTPGYADVWTPERFRRANYVDAMALVSKAAWAQVGGYQHLEHGWEDFDFWCCFVEAGLTGVFVPELLCRYRVHGGSMLRTRTDPGRDGVIAQLSYRHPWLDLQA